MCSWGGGRRSLCNDVRGAGIHYASKAVRCCAGWDGSMGLQYMARRVADSRCVSGLRLGQYRVLPCPHGLLSPAQQGMVDAKRPAPLPPLFPPPLPSFCGIGAEGAAALACGRWPALRSLDLTSHGMDCLERESDGLLGPRGAAALATGSWPKLDTLMVSGNRLGPTGAAFLVSPPSHDRVPPSVAAAAPAAAAAEPATLVLTARYASAPQPPALVRQPLEGGLERTQSCGGRKGPWPALQNLDVSDNKLGGEGVQALLRGEWPQLQRLDLSGNNVPKDAGERCRARFPFADLRRWSL